MSNAITINKQEYLLHFNDQLLDTIEGTMQGRSILGSIIANNGLLPRAVLRQIFTLALLDGKDNSVVKQKAAGEVYDKAIDELGYAGVDQAVIEAMQADVPSYFR